MVRVVDGYEFKGDFTSRRSRLNISINGKKKNEYGGKIESINKRNIVFIIFVLKNDDIHLKKR